MTSSSGVVLDATGEEVVELREALGSGGPETLRREVREEEVDVRFKEAGKKRFAKVAEVEARLSG